jgi:hypothetical protein
MQVKRADNISTIREPRHDRPSVKRWVTSSTAIQMDHNGLGQRSPRSRSVTSGHIVISSNNYRHLPNRFQWLPPDHRLGWSQITQFCMPSPLRPGFKCGK